RGEQWFRARSPHRTNLLLGSSEQAARWSSNNSPRSGREVTGRSQSKLRPRSPSRHEHQLADGVAALQGSMRSGSLTQRKALSRRGLQRTLGGPLLQFAQSLVEHPCVVEHVRKVE